MADIPDVTDALGSGLGTLFYPAGAVGEAVSPLVQMPVRIEAGWPEQQSLKADLLQGKVHVSIYPRPTERITTRYLDDWEAGPVQARTYTATVAGQIITIGGAAPSTYYPQNMAVLINGIAYTVQATANQTSSSLAAVLAGEIGANLSATVNAGQITLPAGARIEAVRVGSSGAMARELRRQEREFQISVWSADPATRDRVSRPINLWIAQTPFLTMPDGYQAHLTYASSMINDFEQKQGLFRRDFFCMVEYATTETDTATAVVVLTEATTEHGATTTSWS